MARKTKSYIIWFVILLLAAVIAIGYYFYNKGPLDVKESNAINITAGELYEFFNKDSAVAQSKYTGKVLAVSGEVKETGVNQQQKKILLLRTTADGAYINCTMEENIGSIHANDKVNIKGICSGMGEADPDLGIMGDVYLTRCYLTK